MAYINLWEVREELVVFLRNNDIFTTTLRGVTTTTEEFNGDGSTVDFTLTPVVGSARNVRSVTVGGTSKALGTDYTVNYNTGVVTFTSAPVSGTDNVDIQYDYGTGDKIFPDFPRDDLTITSFPRIGVDIISGSSAPTGFGNVHGTDLLISVVVQAASTKDISDYGKAIRTAIIGSRNDFYTLKVIIPESIGPIIKSNNKSDKILQQNFDFTSKFNYEIN